MKKAKCMARFGLFLLLMILLFPHSALAAQDGGYDITSELWAKAILETSAKDITLIWKAVGTDITPSGAQVVSGYFYASPDDFAYGSPYNPEVFVKVYIDPSGWANIAFNHVTVDSVSVYSAHGYNGSADQSGSVTLTSRLAEHQYDNVSIDQSLGTRSSATMASTFAATAVGGGYTVNSNLWVKAILQPDSGPITLIWKEVGTDTTATGARVVSGYFYADPDAFAYGSPYNPEVFVKIYIASNGWANIACNHVTVDDVSIDSAHQYSGASDQQGTISLTRRLSEHQYEGVTISNDTENHAPVAFDQSRSVDVFTPYIEQQASASDSDGDTLTYELISAASGTGYSGAYINPSSGMLYVTITNDAIESLDLDFRATDGLLFSNTATISIAFTYYNDEQNTGTNDVDPQDYSQFELSTYNSDLLGDVGEAPAVPLSIDLSANFPVPGDQGRQGSCVGWATAYALKSYHEKVEMGWSLNTAAHLFSPAFVYNQINGGRDQGSYIHEALDLAVSKGIATLETMPYSDTDYLTQPSATALAEGATFKADSWYRVNDTSQIKAALVNRKPVVAGIQVYPQLMELSGSNSVYNTATGQNQGGHAVTIVGYDDERYGGAFKVINSWSSNWGDGGYFWMPYSFAAQDILSQAYVLVDGENGEVTPPDPDDRTEPEPDVSILPNLTVASWNASYDPRPRGTGSLTYSVVNSGSGRAYAGADVNLMLSDNADISASDHYVIYEEIPFDLDSGESVYRDESNSIAFQFPDQLTSGVYYMAVWVDDLGEVAESNEDDNISIGSNTVAITSSLPDLKVNTWYAEWDQYGNGSLTYEVINNGASATTSLNWYINLILDTDQVVGNDNEIFLFYETAGYYLDPGEYIYRDGSYNAPSASFNLYYDYFGYRVPSGTYYMALWVDDLDAEAESNELNNGSYSWGTVSVYGYGANANAASAEADDLLSVAQKRTDLTGKAYNGKKLPPKDVIMRKVEIKRTPDGGTTMTFLDNDEGNFVAQTSEVETLRGKTNASRSSVVFPVVHRKAMPGNGGRSGEK